MDAIKYLLCSGFKNTPKKIKTKKHSLGLLVFIILYFCFIPVLFSYVDLPFLQGADNFVYLLCMGAFAETPYIMFEFLERRGVVFTSTDIHMLFQTPISPKLMLAYGKNKHFLMHALSQIYIAVIGYVVFSVSLPSCITYIAASLIIGTVRDTALAIILYGQDRDNKSIQGIFKGVLYGVLACMAISIVVTIMNTPFGFGLISAYFDSTNTMYIPIVGWEFALIRLCILGPTKQTMIITAINLMFVLGLVLFAYRMPCSGDYFEDAMMYTEQYEYAIQKRKMGGVYLVGQKNIRKPASVTYICDGAHAYFYKAFLEYKKMPLFIFSSITGILAFIAIALSFSKFRGDVVFSFPFCVVLILVFSCIIFQGFGIRWKKEIFSPYFRLTPGHIYTKLFAVVSWEYIKALCEGLLFGIILSVGVGARYIPYALLTTVIYACIRSSRMHLSILCNATISKVLDRFGVTITEYASITIVIIPILGILLAGSMFGAELTGFIIAAITAMVFLGILFVVSCFAAEHIDY